jgi:predicted nuclease of predicted toxin-antitoxin system
MYLLLDECCGKALVRFAEALGHTAQRSVDVAALGRGATDDEVFAFARQGGAVVVTVNRADFIEIAAGSSHPGVLLIPSLPNRKLRPLFELLLKTAEPLLQHQPDLFVEVSADGSVFSFTIP